MPRHPELFKRAGEKLVNYDWTDFISGRSYKRFYAVGLHNDYMLSTQTIASKDNVSVVDVGSVDVDFECTFNNALTMEGDAIVSIPCQMLNNTAGTINPSTATFTATIYHYDGTTATNLGDASFAYSQALSAGNDCETNAALKISIPRTIFNVGDILRLNVDLTLGTSGYGRFYYDSLNITVGSFKSTQLTLDIPFNSND